MPRIIQTIETTATIVGLMIYSATVAIVLLFMFVGLTEMVRF